MGSDFGVVSGSEGRAKEGDFFKRREFSIIFQRESILLLYLTWIKATAVEIVDVIALVIDCWRKKSMILELAVIFLKRETVLENLSASISQERL